ncbi:hypothetical protein K6T82_23605 [Flavobacterium sp. 17A]|uniref:Uncharacterized protein n=1 Tax=Flavobacterium potami TaxID=2872310 RepID=A0A9X1KS92_9FLAO|nr:hypothetical protein [Flavobacterium potami]MBZ4037763.1 hypothetical protein [Flavobacterium potami]
MADIFIYLGYFVLTIDLILYTYSFFRKEEANVFFVSYLAFCFIMQFSMEAMYHFHLNNLFLVNIFIIGQMIFLGLFYNSIFNVKSQKRFVLISVGAALLILAIQFATDWGQFLRFNLFEITLASLLVVIFALIHFYNMLTESKKYYYISIGVMFYLLTSTVLFLIGNLTHNLSKEFKFLSWQLNSVLLVMYYGFILFDWKKNFSKKSVN